MRSFSINGQRLAEDGKDGKLQTRLGVVGHGGGDVGVGVGVVSRRTPAREGVGDLANLTLDGVHVRGGGAFELVGGALGGVVELASKDIGGRLESVVRVVRAE